VAVATVWTSGSGNGLRSVDMPQVFINIIGHNASGKTTIAKRLADRFALNRITGDEFRNFVYTHIPYFFGTDVSYPSRKSSEFNPLGGKYRLELSLVLLRAGQNVINDGSGSTREIRQMYLQKIKTEFPQVKTVIVWANLPEEDLLERIKKRTQEENGRWESMYHQFKKKAFEPPTEEEADVLLHYNQLNYEEIEQRVKELLGL